MEKLFSKVMFVFVFLSFFEMSAQFPRNGGGMGGGGMGGGVDRSIGGGVRENEPKKREPVDYAKVMTDKLTMRLSLDGFQAVVVKNIVDEYIKKSNTIAIEDIHNDAKTEKSKEAQDYMEKKFDEIFTDKQKILFKEFLAENENKSAKGKKKKKKSKSESAE